MGNHGMPGQQRRCASIILSGTVRDSLGQSCQTGHMLIRPAVPDDAIGVARVHVRSWQAGYRKLLPDDYLDRLRPEERAQRYNFGSLDPRQPATIIAAEAG